MVYNTLFYYLRGRKEKRERIREEKEPQHTSSATTKTSYQYHGLSIKKNNAQDVSGRHIAENKSFHTKSLSILPSISHNRDFSTLFPAPSPVIPVPFPLFPPLTPVTAFSESKKSGYLHSLLEVPTEPIRHAPPST